MAAYNAERFIATAIESILLQTHACFELIVIDDGSIDRTAQIIEGFSTRDERVRRVSVPHGGISRALNAGLALARGSWIALMDSDDIALPHRLERQLEAAREVPHVALWGSYARAINTKGTRFHSIALGPTTEDQFLRQRRSGELILVIHPTWLVRREVLVKVGGYDENFQCLVDFELLTRIIIFGSVRVLPEELLLYRVHASNISTRRIVLQRQMEDFLMARNDARRQGRDLSLEAYLKNLAMRPLLMRLIERISDVGRASYREATLHVLEGHYGAASLSAVKAALLSPSHVLGRLWGRLGAGR